ncbi:MAG TPA: S9 family peptidase [Longimicrobium sp.]|nr:S9 family peptidase [Longimicrobium sp.]
MTNRTILALAATLLVLGHPGAGEAQARPGGAAAEEVARTVEAIARMRAAFSPSFSPDGRHLAYISVQSGSPQVWVMPLDGGAAPVQLTHGEDPALAVHWSPAGDWLAYSLWPGGGNNSQIYVMRPDGSAARRLTAGGRENNLLHGWTDDGRRVRMASNEENPGGMDAWLVDPVSGAKTRVTSAGQSRITDVSPDGRHAVVSRGVRGDRNLVLVDVSSGRETPLTPHEGPAYFGWGEFSPDGRRIFVSTNGDRDLVAFGAIDLDGAGRPDPIRLLAARDDAEGESAVLSPDGRMAVLVWNAGGRSELEFLDTGTGRTRPGPVLPVDVLNSAETTFSRDGAMLAVSGSGATRPTDVYTVDVRTGEVTQRTQSAHDGVDLSRFVHPELVRYTANDGLALSGWLYRPAGASGRGPLVFVYHGGPDGQARPMMHDVTQALVARGISVFHPNVRGSTGFGKRFLNLDNGALRVNAIRDIEATTRALVGRGIADPERLGILGGSYGGYMVMAGITEYPEMFAAAVNLFGIVNFETFFAHTEPWMAAISRLEYGDPETQRDVLRRLSPIHRLDRVRTPLLIQHGANDTNVPVMETEQIVEHLRRRQVPVEYLLFPDEGHGWQKVPNRVRSTVGIVVFFDEWLNR